MSIYRCTTCDNIQDADIQGCFSIPHQEFSCVCEDCFLDWENRDEKDLDYE